MAANVETMFSVREKPWHGLGVIVEDAPSSKDALRLAGLDWRVVQKPLFTDSGLVEGYKANIRESDDSVLGVVTDRYKVVQNKNKGVLECQFQIGYKGLIDLAYRNGQMQTIQAQAVYENDEFSYEYGLEPKLFHRPAFSDRGELIYFYGIFRTVNGGYGMSVMSKANMDMYAKTYSKAFASEYSPWKSNYEEMAKKTVIKQALKYAPIDVTRDVLTPSSIYSKEIICTIKVQQLPYGYHAMAEEIAIKNHWNQENAYCYRNTNQNVSVKVYDKVQNLQDYKNEEWKSLDGKGIIRFEVTLEKKSLKKMDDGSNSLIQLIERVLKYADLIYEEHVIFPLDTGVMLSEDVLHKYINRKIPQKIKREKMQECILRCRKEKGNAGMLDSSFMGTEKRTEKVWEYFQKLDVSPIPLKAECPYVPSVSQLIYGENEESSVIQKFAMKHTRGKEYWRNE